MPNNPATAAVVAQMLDAVLTTVVAAGSASTSLERAAAAALGVARLATVILAAVVAREPTPGGTSPLWHPEMHPPRTLGPSRHRSRPWVLVQVAVAVAAAETARDVVEANTPDQLVLVAVKVAARLAVLAPTLLNARSEASKGSSTRARSRRAGRQLRPQWFRVVRSRRRER